MFQDQVALQCQYNECFLSFEEDKDGYLHANSKTAKENEILRLRTDLERDVLKEVDYTPAEDKKKTKDCEKSYMFELPIIESLLSQIFQHSRVDLKNRCISVNMSDRSGVKVAKQEGAMHETMLDRRIKLKSDRYC